MNKLLKNVILTAMMAMTASIGHAQQNGSNTTTAQQEATADLDAKYATNLLKPGTEAPAINIKTINGKKFSLKSLQGKYVVIDFWASWCPDCRKDAPNIIAMYNKFHGKSVEFVGVSFDTKPESWKSCVEKLGIPYTQASDLKNMRESEVAQAYNIKWIPTVYIIDPQGKVALATVMSEKASAFLTSVYPDCAE